MSTENKSLTTFLSEWGGQVNAMIENSGEADTVSSGEITYIGYRYPDWQGYSVMRYDSLYMTDANYMQAHAIVYYSYSGNKKPTFELIRSADNTEQGEDLCIITPIDSEVVDKPGVYSIDLEINGENANYSDSSYEWFIRGHLGNKTFDYSFTIYEFGD